MMINRLTILGRDRVPRAIGMKTDISRCGICTDFLEQAASYTQSKCSHIHTMPQDRNHSNLDIYHDDVFNHILN